MHSVFCTVCCEFYFISKGPSPPPPSPLSHREKVNSLCPASHLLPPPPGQSKFTSSRQGREGEGRRDLPPLPFPSLALCTEQVRNQQQYERCVRHASPVWYIMLLMRENPLLGQVVRGLGPGKLDFFGPQMVFA